MFRFSKKIRSPQLIKERRKKVYINTALYFVLALSVVFLLSQVSFIKSINIKNIEVFGNEITQSKEILDIVQKNIDGKYLFLLSKKNILIYPRKKIENIILDTYPRIYDVDIDAESFSKISVTVRERESFGLWCGVEKEAQCYFVDYTGYIFAPAPSFSGNVFFVYSGQTESMQGGAIKKHFIDKNSFFELNAFIKAVGDFGLSAYKLQIHKDNYFVLYTDSGYILFDDIENQSGVLENLGSVLASEVFTNTDGEISDFEYIDLRFGNKVFFK